MADFGCYDELPSVPSNMGDQERRRPRRAAAAAAADVLIATALEEEDELYQETPPRVPKRRGGKQIAAGPGGGRGEHAYNYADNGAAGAGVGAARKRRVEQVDNGEEGPNPIAILPPAPTAAPATGALPLQGVLQPAGMTAYAYAYYNASALAAAAGYQGAALGNGMQYGFQGLQAVQAMQSLQYAQGLQGLHGGGNGIVSAALPAQDGSVAATGLVPPVPSAAAAAVAAPPRKRGRAAAGGGGATANVPLVPGNGSKFFPKESQEEVCRFLLLLVASEARQRGEVSDVPEITQVARERVRQLQPQLRELVPPGVGLDWGGPIKRLELACYRAVEDLCGDLQDPLDAAIAAQLLAIGKGTSSNGNGQTSRAGSSGGASDGGSSGTGESSGLLGNTASASLAASRRNRQLNAMKQTFLAELQEAIDELVRCRVDAMKQAAAKEYNEHMAGILAGLPPELCGIPENVPGAPLPAAVLHNREPYFSVPEWRKQPFQPRSYETLTSYAIRSAIPSECAVLRAKLKTRRPDGAAEHFTLEHGKELGMEECKQKEAQLAAAVRGRRALVLGEHVKEVDCWGMDCYTRRNIFDAVRESGAFKHCRTGEAASKSQGAGTTGTGNCSTDPDDPETADTAAGRMAGPTGLSGGSAADPLRVKAERQGSGREPSPPGAGPAVRIKEEMGIKLEPEVKQEAQPVHGQGGDMTRDDAAIAAALAAAEAEAGGRTGSRQGRGPSRRRAAAAAGEKMQSGTDGVDAAAGQPPLPPPPPPCDPGEAEAINNWIDRCVLCTAIAKGPDGWNLLRVLEAVQADARTRGDKPCGKAASAVISRLKQIGWAYFRLHPKGRGVVCCVPDGLPAFTFVEEYLGELHSPWRWFETQDAIKKLTQQELPDFYNITLERPRDDPDGYDVMFVEAAFMASFASRMSHSCTPNCAAVVVSVNGRLTIAMYAKRKIEPGEELTFDYSSVTESEKEYREAICLCGSRNCRGSYLYYSGSTAFTQIMEQRHNFLHRQVMLLRASMEAVTEDDRVRLRKHSLGPTSLGDGTPGNNKAPEWLVKWAALVLEYVELERRELPGVLLQLPPQLGKYTPESAEIEAEAIAQNRVQQIVITLDKVKHVLRQPGQLQTPPMRKLTEPEELAHLWSGANSIAKRVLKSAAAHLSPSTAITTKLLALWSTGGGGAAGAAPATRGGRSGAASTPSDDEGAAAAPQRRGRGGGGDSEDMAGVLSERLREFADGPDGQKAPQLAKVARLVAKKASTAADARRLLLELEATFRAIDLEEGAGHHTAAADMLHLYGSTLTWFTAERGYKGFASPPIELHEEMAKLHRVKLGVGRGGKSGGAGGASAARKARAAATPASPSDLDTSEEEEDGSDGDGRARKARGGRGGRGGRVGRGGRAGRGHGGRGPGSSKAPPVAAAAATPRRGEDLVKEGDADGMDGSGGAANSSSPSFIVKVHKPPSSSSIRVEDPAVLSKRYGPWFMWGQLSGWFKQTVYDPTASLSAERRGTLSLPDMESCYGARSRYTNKDRTAVLRHLESSPDAQWKTSLQFAFRNDAKIYGSPMFDQVYLEAVGAPHLNPMPEVLRHLKTVKTPLQGRAGR
ncbi:hypothetical protein Agub_g7609 [Astrephomene gubernaculifera]|uniref:SET domain-containing protein n=1 Tax=Astrephomene gubernaculifera TaxID=47775 RepID=A0AAD3DQE8_9CHLO|nr:hypothetical protein Agub_g7609 [Astrephomene gubernaculifera]